MLVFGCASSKQPDPQAIAQSKVDAAIVRQRLLEASSNTSQPLPQEPVLQQAAEAHSVDASASDSKPRVLAPGYKIRLTTLEDEQLNGEFTVNFDGVLELPYGVKARVGGQPESSLTQLVISAYSSFFRMPPTISTEILDRTYLVEVQGLVQEPGQYVFRARSSLDELMAKAGGLRTGAGSEPLAKYVRIQERDGAVQTIKLDEYYSGSVDAVPAWSGGEQVFFQSEGPQAGPGDRREYVHMLGEIETPGEYAMRGEAGFFFYLARAGGPTAQADLRKVEVVRVNGTQKQSTFVDLVEAKSLPTLESGDIVMVHSKDNNQAISNVTSVINSMATILLAAVAL